MTGTPGPPGRARGARFKLGLLLAAQLAKPELAEAHGSWSPSNGNGHARAREPR